MTQQVLKSVLHDKFSEQANPYKTIWQLRGDTHFPLASSLVVEYMDKFFYRQSPLTSWFKLLSYIFTSIFFFFLLKILHMQLNQVLDQLTTCRQRTLGNSSSTWVLSSIINVGFRHERRSTNSMADALVKLGVQWMSCRVAFIM